MRARIRNLRIKADLTQAALAAHAGISLQTIKDIESGRTEAGQKSERALAKAFGITIEEMTGQDEPEPQVIKEKPISVSKFLKKISNVPDDIFDLAENVSLDDEAWDTVRSALEIARDRKEKKKVSNK